MTTAGAMVKASGRKTSLQKLAVPLQKRFLTIRILWAFAILSNTIVPKICIHGCDGSIKFRNFRLEEIYMNGVNINTLDSFETLFKNVANVTIDSARGC